MPKSSVNSLSIVVNADATYSLVFTAKEDGGDTIELVMLEDADQNLVKVYGKVISGLLEVPLNDETTTPPTAPAQ